MNKVEFDVRELCRAFKCETDQYKAMDLPAEWAMPGPWHFSSCGTDSSNQPQPLSITTMNHAPAIQTFQCECRIFSGLSGDKCLSVNAVCDRRSGEGAESLML